MADNTTSGTNRTHDTQSAKKTVQDARDQAEQTAGRIRDEAREGFDQAKSSILAEGEARKDRAAGAVGETASSLRSAAADLDAGSPQQQILQQAADGLTAIADNIQGKSLGEMVDGVSQFARRNPAAFLGGAALAGFAIARFARASQRAREQDEYGHDDPVVYSGASAYSSPANTGSMASDRVPPTTPPTTASPASVPPVTASNPTSGSTSTTTGSTATSVGTGSPSTGTPTGVHPTAASTTTPGATTSPTPTPTSTAPRPAGSTRKDS